MRGPAATNYKYWNKVKYPKPLCLSGPCRRGGRIIITSYRHSLGLAVITLGKIRTGRRLSYRGKLRISKYWRFLGRIRISSRELRGFHQSNSSWLTQDPVSIMWPSLSRRGLKCLVLIPRLASLKLFSISSILISTNPYPPFLPISMLTAIMKTKVTLFLCRQLARTQLTPYWSL